jgi:hypothetical protein
MSLSGFAVTSAFCAWSPGDRERPERRVFISPGLKNLFTDEAEPSGAFIKFLQCGQWYEADRSEFLRCTVRLHTHEEVSVRRGA